MMTRLEGLEQTCFSRDLDVQKMGNTGKYPVKTIFGAQNHFAWQGYYIDDKIQLIIERVLKV